MSLTKIVTAVSMATALTLAMSSTALAAEVTQSQEMSANSSVKVVCNTGSYGQDSTCTAEASSEAKGKQTQTVIYRDGQVLAAHKPVDTGLDLPTSMMVGASVLAGTGAGLLQLKKIIG